MPAKPADKRALFDFEQLLSFRLSSIFSLISTATGQTLKPHGLLLREWRVLGMLAGSPPTSASELVARTPLDKASVSRAVTGLTEKGLVQASPSAADARVSLLELTDAGWDMYLKIAPWAVWRDKALLGVLTQAERSHLLSMLSRIEREAARHVRDESFAAAREGDRLRK